jgi:hypothetical protein
MSPTPKTAPSTEASYPHGEAQGLYCLTHQMIVPKKTATASARTQIDCDKTASTVRGIPIRRRTRSRAIGSRDNGMCPEHTATADGDSPAS